MEVLDADAARRAFDLDKLERRVGTDTAACLYDESVPKHRHGARHDD